MTTITFKEMTAIQQNRFLRKVCGLNKDQARYAKMIVGSFGKSIEDAVYEAKNNYSSLGEVITHITKDA
jgi:hypothetical protein